MEQKIPTAATIRVQLALIGHAQTQELSRISGVPFTTLWKIRNGITKNPRIETVAQFFHLINPVKVVDGGDNTTHDLETAMTEAAKAGLIDRRTVVRRADDRKRLGVDIASAGQGV